jgi:cell division protein FtsZ
MTINLSIPPANPTPELKPRITVFGVGGAGGNAVNNMICSHLEGVEFVVANTDAQALAQSRAERRIQLGVTVTQGLGAGSRPDIGRIAAEEALEEIIEELRGSNMAFIAAGMGGGTGTGAGPVIARAAREQGILTVGVVTKPFHFEGSNRMRLAETGMEELEQFVDTLLIIPNQNLFRIANERTTFSDAFKMADDVLYSGVRGVTDLMVMPGLINLDFADIRAVMSEMGKAMMGTGEAEGERRALDAAEAAISNPLLDDVSMKGARGMLINITGGYDMTLFEVDEAANRVRSEVDPDAYIIFGSTFDESMEGQMRVSVVATGMDAATAAHPVPAKTEALSAVGNPRPLRAAARVTEVAAGDIFAQRNETSDAKPELVSDGAAANFVHASDLQQPAGDKQETQVSAVAATGHAPPLPASGDAFIPPAPATRSGVAAMRGHDASSDPVIPDIGKDPDTNVGADSQRSRPKVASLFASVMGAGRSSKASKADSEPQAPQVASPTAEKGMRLGAVNAEERLPSSQPEDDLLDIPTFLRRQAN